MIELKALDIVLDDGRSSYCGGEMIRGHVVVDFEDQAEMWNIQVRFYGEGYSQVNNVHGSANRNATKKRESIVDLQKVLFGLKSNEIAERIPMHSHGQSVYDFSFLVPKYVPCSFESPNDSEYGMAYLRYFLQATITRPWSKNISKEVAITVNQIIDTSLPEYSYRPGCQAEQQLGTFCFPDGRLYIEAYLNDVCYNQSSDILITCKAENDSKRIMSSLYAKLFKRTRYRRKRESKTYLDVVSEYFGDRVLPKKTVTWDNIEFKVPASVGPTITKSNRVNVDYFVRVGMYQLFREEIHVDLPIVIGTTKAFLIEKTRMEQEKNQDLSICVGDERPDVSQLNGSNEQCILSSDFSSRRASESNLHTDSKPRAALGSRNVRVPPGSIPWKIATGRPSVRKAASHSSIDTRNIGPSASIEGGHQRKNLSSSRALEMQQTGRKPFVSKKVDLKELATIAIGVGYARRATNIKSPNTKQNDVGVSKGKKNDAGANKARFGQGKAEGIKKASLNGFANTKNGGAVKSATSSIRSSPLNTNTEDKKLEQAVKAKSVASSQRKISPSIRDKQLKTNETVPPKETNPNRSSKTPKNGTVQRSQSKVSALNAFSKGASKPSVKTSNGVTKAVGKNDIGENKKFGASLRNDNTVPRRIGTAVRKSNSQPENDARKGKSSPKNVSMLRKKSSLTTSTKDKHLKENNVAAVDSDTKRDDKSSDDLKKERNDLENHNYAETGDEATNIDFSTKNVNAEDDNCVQKAANDSLPNRIQNNVIQDGLDKGSLDEEELTAVEQEAIESSPNAVSTAEESSMGSRVPQNGLEATLGMPVKGNEEESVLNTVNNQDKVESSLSLASSGGGSCDELAQKKGLEIYQEDAIVPIEEELNVESSPFNFEDLEEDFMTEQSSNVLASKDSLINESVLGFEESESHLERAPSLDEFELIESQLLSEGETEGEKHALTDSSGNEGVLKRQFIEGVGSTSMHVLEDGTQSENKRHFTNGLDNSEVIRETASPRSNAKDASRRRERVSLNNRNAPLMTMSTNDKPTKIRKTSASMQNRSPPSTIENSKETTSHQSEQKSTLKSNISGISGHDITEGTLNPNSKISIPNGHANRQTDESETSAPLAFNGRHILQSTRDLQGQETENIAQGIGVYGETRNRNGTSHLTESSKTAKIAIAEDSNAKVSWKGTFTKVRTMQSSEKSRRKSILNIKVLGENSKT